MFFDFYPTLLKCAKLINGFRCFPLLYKSWFNWLLIHCLSFHWFLSQRKPCEGDEFCPYPFYPVPLPPEGQQSDQTHQPNTNSNANPNSNGNIGKKNLIRPKPGKKITFVADDEQNAYLLIKNLFDKRCPWNYSGPQYNNLTWFTPNCFVKMKNAFKNAN